MTRIASALRRLADWLYAAADRIEPTLDWADPNIEDVEVWSCGATYTAGSETRE